MASNNFFCQIAAAYFSGLTNGTSPTTYSPSDNVTREQMAAFTTRTLGQSLLGWSTQAAFDGERILVTNFGNHSVSL